MLRVGVIGATGYTGEELIKILLKHTKVKISYLSAKVEKPKKISEIFPYLKDKLLLLCDNFNIDRALKFCDLLFLAVPHTASMQITPILLKNKKYVIDLSADYRLKDKNLYEFWYKTKHRDRRNLKKAVYGLPEVYKEKIKKTRLVANPGCYPTAAILSIAPLLKYKICKIQYIYIDAKSGYSGAGRISDEQFYRDLKDNFKAYNVDLHRHLPEITEQISSLAERKLNIVFVTHLLPIERGISETIYVNLNHRLKIKDSELIGLYREFYKDKPFVRIKEKNHFPQIKDVALTNFCDIGIKISEDKKTIILISCIDNLLKGASGQAVQNMNIMFDFEETEALL